MGKLLTVLGVSEAKQAKLPASVFTAEKIVDGLQRAYAAAPESPKKDQLALAISESVRIMMAKVQPYLIEEKKEEQVKKEDSKLPQETRMPEPPVPAPPTPEDEPPMPKPEEKPEKKDEEEKPKRKQKPTPPPTSPEAPQPPKAPKPKDDDGGDSGNPTDEPMTCDEIKDAIKGLNLIAKMGDSEAADIIKQLKIKLKNQNCK